MQDADKGVFSGLIANVYAFYRQDTSDFAIGVWWQAMTPFDFQAVSDALNRHCVNPDNGQFMPKPADIVKMLQGSTQDSAMVAWAKVDKAIRQCGTYASVAFDDPIIHRVIGDMGGWVQLGMKEEKEWPFVAKEFENRYRGYKMRNEVPDYPKVLIGISEAQNCQQGFRPEPPILIGSPEAATRVVLGGSNRPAIEMTRSIDVAALVTVDGEDEES